MKSLLALPWILLFVAVVAVLYFVFPRHDAPPVGQPDAKRPAVNAPHANVLSVSTETFTDQVLRNRKPVLVDFTAKWCGPCRTMTPRIESLAKDFEVRVVDIDADPRLADRYKIQSIPAMLIFVNGEVAYNHVGLVAEATLRNKLLELSRQ